MGTQQKGEGATCSWTGSDSHALGRWGVSVGDSRSLGSTALEPLPGSQEQTSPERALRKALRSKAFLFSCHVQGPPGFELHCVLGTSLHCSNR